MIRAVYVRVETTADNNQWEALLTHIKAHPGVTDAEVSDWEQD